MAIKITPAFLDRLHGLAQNCQPPIWELNEHSDVVSVAHTVAEVAYEEDAQFIAEADPSTVLAMVEEIAVLQRTVRNLVMKYQYDAYDDDIEYEIDQARHQLESEDGHGK